MSAGLAGLSHDAPAAAAAASEAQSPHVAQHWHPPQGHTLASAMCI